MPTFYIGDGEMLEIYDDVRVMEELERLSQHTCDEVQSRIQAVYLWMLRQHAAEAK